MAICRRSWMGLFGAVVGIATALSSGHSHGETVNYRDLRIEVQGRGRPVLMIPGLNSAAGTWTETCTALQPEVQCHIVQLPGFAGAAPVRTEAFLDDMRDRLLSYVADRRLDRPVAMGHSLGGALAMKMAAVRPAGFSHLIIVDSLPFLGGLRGATPQEAQAMAADMRARMSQATPEQWKAGARQSAQGMTRDPERVRQIASWSEASDQMTSAQAMSELWSDDLRPLLPRLTLPTLVLGSWAAYEPMGSTMETTRRIFEQQYAGAPQLTLAMSARGYHFLMWDDADWLVAQVKDFIARP